jgi:hypothetical protein
MYFLSSPRPAGGYIERDNPHIDCPTHVMGVPK